MNRKPIVPAGSPLTPRADGFYAKIHGKTRYCGGPNDYEKALKKYHELALEGLADTPVRVERVEGAPVPLRDLARRYLWERQQDVNASKLSPGTYADYEDGITFAVKMIGGDLDANRLRPDDFTPVARAWEAKFGHESYNRNIQAVRTMFNKAYEHEWIDRIPRFGPYFKKKNASEMRKARKRVPLQATTFGDIFDAAGVKLRAMLELGARAGYTAADCAALRMHHLQESGVLEKDGFFEFPRPKTGIRRFTYVGPTLRKVMIDAIALHAKRRCIKPADKDRVFLTLQGRPWCYDIVKRDDANNITKVVCIDSVGRAFRKLIKKLNADRAEKLNSEFRRFRKWFFSHAKAAKGHDRDAARVMMGWKFPGVEEVYDDGALPDRLKIISDHIDATLKLASKKPGRRRRER